MGAEGPGGRDRKADTTMRRTVHLLTILAFGWALLLAPAGVAGAEAASPSGAVASATVLAQAPDQQDQNSGQQIPERQRVVIGIAGLALIGAVLGTRKARKKPVLLVSWKRKG